MEWTLNTKSRPRCIHGQAREAKGAFEAEVPERHEQKGRGFLEELVLDYEVANL